MIGSPSVAWGVDRLFRLGRPRPAAFLVGAVAAVGAGWVASRSSGQLRYLLTAVLFLLLWSVVLLRPRWAVIGVMAGLPFLAFVRRILIAPVGWTSYDPLLVLAPLVAVAILLRLFFFERRPVAPDLLSRGVAALLVLAVLEVFNPAVGIGEGVIGLLFIAVPLLWFFIGREIADRRLLTIILGVWVVEAFAVAGYGLWQTYVGLPIWDLQWLYVTNYAALNVGGTIRAFGTFSSSAEYATFLGVAAVTLVSLALRGHWYLLVPAGFFVWVQFIDSSRGITVFTICGILAVAGLRVSRRWGVVAALVGVGAYLALVQAFTVPLNHVADTITEPLLAHQVQGLINPFDTSKSTLGVHQTFIADSLSESATRPFGLGTARFNTKAGAGGSEFDVSETLAGLGWLGGALYLGVIALALRALHGASVRNRRTLEVVTAGILIATFGHWLTGGYYVLSPMVWLLMGWSLRSRTETDAPAPLPA